MVYIEIETGKFKHCQITLYTSFPAQQYDTLENYLNLLNFHVTLSFIGQLCTIKQLSCLDKYWTNNQQSIYNIVY